LLILCIAILVISFTIVIDVYIVMTVASDVKVSLHLCQRNEENEKWKECNVCLIVIYIFREFNANFISACNISICSFTTSWVMIFGKAILWSNIYFWIKFFHYYEESLHTYVSSTCPKVCACICLHPEHSIYLQCLFLPELQ